jgi:hypothetical protein
MLMIPPIVSLSDVVRWAMGLAVACRAEGVLYVRIGGPSGPFGVCPCSRSRSARGTELGGSVSAEPKVFLLTDLYGSGITDG